MVSALYFQLAAAPGFEDTFRTGLLALQRNDLKTAEFNLLAAAKLAPGNGRVWIALAQTYRKLNQPPQADAAAAKATLLGASDSLVQKSLVIYYSESRQNFKAAEAQARYSLLNPQDSAAREKAEALYFESAQPLLQQQKFAEAIVALRQACEQVKGSAQLELALGVAYYGLRQFDEAATALLATIAIDPEIEQPYVFLGKSLDQIPGRLPEALRLFVIYQRTHPTRALGYLLHAKVLNAQGTEPENTQRLLEKAISLDEREPSAHFELGSLHYRARRYEEAAKEFERCLALDPQNAAAHYRLANVYSRLGKLEAAQAERGLHAKLVKEQESRK
jgi:tetratricopeptide (TPR) repeat protein